MHPNCSIACMKAAAVRPFPARYVLQDRKLGIMWLMTDQIVSDMLQKYFPEHFRGIRGTMQATLVRRTP